MNQLISIIIPTYGRPTTLKRSIDSVLSQTYNKIEIIVVDDNNPDTESRKETEEVMSTFSDSRVIYIKHEHNKNGSAARNTGIRKASGKYIAFLDDDDTFHPEKLEKQVKKLESLNEEYGLCYTGYRIIRKSGEEHYSTEKREGNCYLAALMRTFYICGGSNLLIKKSVVDEINGFDESFKRNQDIEFITRALQNYKIAYVNETLLDIHQDDAIRKKQPYEIVDTYSKHYLEKFNDRISALNESDRKRVISVISLDRCRVAFQYKHYRKGFAILKENKVPFSYKFKYFKYLVKRFITKKSYGFDGK